MQPNEPGRVLIKNLIDEYDRYKTIAEKAIVQVSEANWNRVVSPDNNSIAMIMRHISGNFISRFTDFLTADGEKSWRDRDSEFEEGDYRAEELRQRWDQGWGVLAAELSRLSDEHLQQEVYIRGHALSVHAALCRSLAHVSYHVGQIVFLARILKEGNWESMSIPRGRSVEYNRNPTKEKTPR